MNKRPIHARRGVVTVLVVAGMVLLATGAAATAICATQHAETAVLRASAAQARAAADTALLLALREIATGVDSDGDSHVGGLSDDGNDDNDPTLAGARAHVHRAGTQLTATATCGEARTTQHATSTEHTSP